jgi:hypothetical protein
MHILREIIELAVVDAPFANKALSTAISGHVVLFHNATQDAVGPSRSNDIGIFVAYETLSIFWSFLALEIVGKPQLPLAPMNVDPVCSCRA